MEAVCACAMLMATTIYPLHQNLLLIFLQTLLQIRDHLLQMLDSRLRVLTLSDFEWQRDIEVGFGVPQEVLEYENRLLAFSDVLAQLCSLKTSLLSILSRFLALDVIGEVESVPEVLNFKL